MFSSFIKKIDSKYFLYLAWFISLSGMLGSLFFSEILKFPPCVLCWYQRIALYPLVAIFPVGILRKDSGVDFYARPFVFIGFLIALYHNLLYYGIIPETLSPCEVGVSCLTKYVEYFGFITIPLLSLGAFIALGVILVAYRKNTSENITVN